MCSIGSCQNPGEYERRIKCGCPVLLCKEHLAEWIAGKRTTAINFYHNRNCNNRTLAGITKRFQLICAPEVM